MATATLEKLEKEMRMLKNKMGILEQALMTPFDDEGKYKPSFVKHILKRASQKSQKAFEFRKKGDLIKYLAR